MKEESSISRFFGTLLHLALTMIVIGVVISLAKSKDSGENINPVEEIGKKSHEVIIDLKKGWSNAGKKDTIK
jgi:hypothetical protein